MKKSRRKGFFILLVMIILMIIYVLSQGDEIDRRSATHDGAVPVTITLPDDE
jgi:hypothetical protein